MSLSDAAQTDAGGSYVWGRLSAFGLTVAALTCAADQAAKFWLLFAFHLGDSVGQLRIGPFSIWC